ncbi:MAG: hypothetical protein JSV49_11125 [Thermoplasmata archaeon]|nr:MAG: hypothetical protein JSV49_11125 [Thermoplasmata archaeon]
MNLNKHLEKAKRLDSLQAKMDPETEWEIIIETVYGASLHYIAYFCEKSFGNHLNTHKGLPKFLDENNLIKLAVLFRELDMHRHGKWYGSQGNGETVERVRLILIDIKSECGIVET